MKSILVAAVVAISAVTAGAGELQQAAARGDVARVRALLQADPGAVNERDGATTPLHEATRGGHIEVVKLLVASGANVNATDFSKLTPLRLALGYQRSAIAEYLRQHGGVEQVAPPLPAALANGGPSAVVPSTVRSTPALFASNAPAARTMSPVGAMTNAIVRAPVVTNKPPSEQEQLLVNFPIHEAARAGDVETIKLLFKNSPDVIDATDEKGLTPLHVAAANRQLKVAETLIGLRAKLNAKTLNGETPLHLALRRGDGAIVTLLVTNHAAVNERDNAGQTPLHLAVRRGDLATASLLLTNRASVDERDNLGHTPLLLALQSAGAEALEIAGNTFQKGNGLAANGPGFGRRPAQPDMTELLVRARAEVSARSASVIDLLLRAGANPNVAETGTGKTPLHFAAALGHAPIIEMLVRHRGAVDAMDRRGETPLCYALREARTNSIAALRAAGATVGKTRPLNATEQSLVEFYERTENALQRASSSDKARILTALNPTRSDCEKMFPRHSAQATKIVDEINKQIRQAFAHPVRDAEQGKEIWRVLPDSPSAIVQEWRGRGALAGGLPVYSLIVDKIGGTTRPGDYCFVNGRWVLVPPLRTIAAQVASTEAAHR